MLILAWTEEVASTRCSHPYNSIFLRPNISYTCHIALWLAGLSMSTASRKLRARMTLRWALASVCWENFTSYDSSSVTGILIPAMCWENKIIYVAKSNLQNNAEHWSAPTVFGNKNQSEPQRKRSFQNGKRFSEWKWTSSRNEDNRLFPRFSQTFWRANLQNYGRAYPTDVQPIHHSTTLLPFWMDSPTIYEEANFGG